MSLALEVRRVLACVEVVHERGVLTVGCGEEVATMGELDFAALLDLDVFELVEGLGKHVHQQDLVLDGHNDMETRWMECDGEGFLLLLVANLKGLGDVVPDLDSLVS